MARKTEWNHKLEEISARLNDWPVEVLDRAAIEILFEISPRQASRLLHRFGASKVGGALVVGKLALLQHLARMAGGEEAHYELRRRERLERTLEQARRDLRARRIAIPTPEPFPETMGELPEGVDLQPGTLLVRFSTPVELLQRLMQLTQAIAQDWDGYVARSGSSGRTSF